MPKIHVPAQMYKTPRRFDRKDKTTGELTGSVSFIHSLIIDGEQADLFADVDLTHDLNGSRDKLDTGAPVPVVAVLDVSVYRGRLSPRLEGLSEPGKS